MNSRNNIDKIIGKNLKGLLLINNMTFFTCLLEVARLMRKKSKIDPLFYFPQYYPNIERDISTAIDEDMDYIIGFRESPEKGTDAAAQKEIENNYIIGLLKRIMRFLHARTIVYLFRELFKYYKEFKKAYRIVKDKKPSIIILAGDNLGYNTSVFIKVGHKNSIPSVIIPSWMAGPKEAAEAYYYNPEHDCRKISNYIAGVIYPDYVYKHKEKKILRWPAYKIIAMKLFKVASRLPWVLNSSDADAILVESKAMYKYMLQEGLPVKKLKLVGSLANDMLFNNMNDVINNKNKLYGQLNMPADKPMLLSALPPDQLYGYGRPECEFNTYREIVEFWVKSLAGAENCNVIISLHPSVKYEDVKYIEEWGCRIAQDNIKMLIPLADIFVASISSTIQWAIACGKPTINYDVYKYKYSDYVKVEGVLYVEEKNAFVNYIKKITRHKNFYSKIQDKQMDCRGEWGIMDGKCGERTLKCFDELIRMDK